MKISDKNHILNIPSEINISQVEEFCTDSRKRPIDPTKAIFIALKGENYDGHHFIEEAYNLGIRKFIVEKTYNNTIDAFFWKVENTLQKMQELATVYRNSFEYPCVGITGSNGKTIVKEFLFHLLNSKFKVERSPKSYNSQIGVPLSILLSSNKADLGIFEAGISQKGEMTTLEKIIHPEIGIFINIGDAHESGFLNIKEKIKEKALLFKNSDKIIFCSDDEDISAVLKENFKEEQLFCWSKKDKNASVYLKENKQLKNGNQELNIIYKEDEYKIIIPFKSAIWIENAMHTFTFLALNNYLNKIDLSLFETLPKLEMRFEKRKGLYASTLINDAYSNDFQSLKFAIEELNDGAEEKLLILSDFIDSYKNKEAYYKQIALYLKNYPNYSVIGIGSDWKKYSSLLKNKSIAFETSKQFLTAWNKRNLSNKRVLIKGARKFKFEQIVQAFSERPHSTELTIDLNALKNNFHYFQSFLKPQTQIVVMIKAFSYGVGAVELALELQKENIAAFAVAYVNEGIELRNAGINKRIIVLNHEESLINLMIENDLEPEIYSLDLIKKWNTILSEKSIKNQIIHLKLDTGMNRLGFKKTDDKELINYLKNTNNFKIDSVFSHLVDSSTKAGKEFTEKQISEFTTRTDFLKQQLGATFKKHILNSNGIFNYPEAQFNWVRLGIGLFGVEIYSEHKEKLETVLKWTTKISQIKNIEQGESVGYNRSFIAKETKKIATLSIGYADGLSRAFGNKKGVVIINGIPCTIIGAICMDMTMVDVTNIENIAVGQEVILFDDTYQTLENFSRQINTISYEILCTISERVQRTYLKEN